MGYNQSTREDAQADRAFHNLADKLAGYPDSIGYPADQGGYRKVHDILDNASKLHDMQQHPNYRLPVPLPKEDYFDFCMRAAGLLVSPPQEEEESEELECVDIKAALLAYAPELRRAWNDYHGNPN